MRSGCSSMRWACTTTVLYSTAFDLRISVRNASFNDAASPVGADGGGETGVGRGAVSDGAAAAGALFGATGGDETPRAGAAGIGAIGRDGAAAAGRNRPLPD